MLERQWTDELRRSYRNGMIVGLISGLSIGLGIWAMMP